MTEKKPMKRQRKVSSRILWLICVLAAGAFCYSFYHLPMFPRKWSFFAIGFVFVLLALLFLITTKTKPYNRLVKFLNLLVTVTLFIGSIGLPYYTDKVASVFDQVVGNSVKIHVYALKDSYKQSHPTLLSSYKENKPIGEWSSAKFGGFSMIDKDNQSYGFESLSKQLNHSVNRMNYDTLASAAQALYSGEIDGLVMSEPFAQLLSENEKYLQFKEETYSVATYIRELPSIRGTSENLANKPFVVFLAGNDQPGELSLVGRTDVDMVIGVNPNNHQVLMVNLPRDSYVENPAYGNQKDKLTHLGISGLENTMKGISNLLNTKVDHYALVNFSTFLNIVSVLGGVDIENPYAFRALDGRYFKAGSIHLDADQALMYVRERKNLRNGDFDRNMHQQLVMKAIIKKMTSAQGLVNFSGLLDSLKDSFLTNIDSKDIYALANKQLDKGGSWQIINYHLTGQADLLKTASVPGQKLSVVLLNSKQLEFVQTEFEKILKGEEISQSTLPE